MVSSQDSKKIPPKQASVLVPNQPTQYCLRMDKISFLMPNIDKSINGVGQIILDANLSDT
jgi:hypothetical protein